MTYTGAGPTVQYTGAKGEGCCNLRNFLYGVLCILVLVLVAGCVALAVRPSQKSALEEFAQIQKEFDCDTSLGNWHQEWTFERKDYCCKTQKTTCENELEPERKTHYDCTVVQASWTGHHRAFCCSEWDIGCPKEHRFRQGSFYDCAAGYANWQNGWSDDKKAWCCKQEGAGCTNSLPYDCQAGYSNWALGWSEGKKQWCCQHERKACIKPFDCTAGQSNWKKGWSDSKKKWCCEHEGNGCPEPYDCSAGLANGQSGWSSSKKEYCCRKYQAGCSVREETTTTLTPESYKPRDIRGKSLYFIVADYFADPTPATNLSNNCAGQIWCNGTIKGITNHLDYIQGMGFEGIWVTPLVKQFYGPDPDGRSGYGQYGYWAYDWYKIDEHYGTEEDLKELSRELHKRDMVFVYDIVLNHVGPVHSVEMVHQIVPFDKTEYFHQLDIRNLTFDEYSKGFAYGGKGYPPPVQALGPGAMCFAGPEGCNNYKCPVDPGFGNPCPVTPTYLGDDAPGPRDIPMCGVGDYVCAGYNEQQTIEGWFYDLGDLNHSHPFVHDELIRWGIHMKDTYQIDGFRLDTAPYVRKDFLSDFQEAVGIPILGEVTASNKTFFESFAPRTTGNEKPVLKGLLNFYLQNVATPGFCGPPAFFPGADLNLSRLAENTNLQQHGDLNDLLLLGNFVDNHDMSRLAFFCSSVMSRMKNALAWTMLTLGIPIIYYGTEHFFTEQHPPMWGAGGGYDTATPGYQFLRGLNSVRKTLDLHAADMEIKQADQNHVVFTRGEHAWIFLNNFNGTEPVKYNVAGTMPSCGSGRVYVDILHGHELASVENGYFMAPDTDPAVLVCHDRPAQ